MEFIIKYLGPGRVASVAFTVLLLFGRRAAARRLTAKLPDGQHCGIGTVGIGTVAHHHAATQPPPRQCQMTALQVTALQAAICAAAARTTRAY
eukprot:SAG31_NODE_75_length_27561_cov_28.859333_16_plen_93_part_00